MTTLQKPNIFDMAKQNIKNPFIVEHNTVGSMIYTAMYVATPGSNVVPEIEMRFKSVMADKAHVSALHYKVMRNSFGTIELPTTVEQIYKNNVRKRDGHWMVKDNVGKSNEMVSPYSKLSGRVHMVLERTLDDNHSLVKSILATHEEPILTRTKKTSKYVGKFWNMFISQVDINRNGMNYTDYELELEMNVENASFINESKTNNVQNHIKFISTGPMQEYDELTEQIDIMGRLCVLYQSSFNAKDSFVGNMPKQLINEYIPIIQSKQYAITPKLDGLRTFLIFSDMLPRAMLLERNMKSTIVPHKLPSTNKFVISDKGENPRMLSLTVFDCELYHDKSTNTNDLYIFDCLYADGKDVMGMTLQQRMSAAQYIIENTYDMSMVLNLKLKTYYYQQCGSGGNIENIFKYAKVIWDDYLKLAGGMTYDGIIFSPNDAASTYIDSAHYKWKDKYTIDVLIKDKNMYARTGNQLKNITNEIIDEKHAELLDKYDGKIVEYDIRAHEVMTVRVDRDQPNAYLTCLSTKKAMNEDLNIDKLASMAQPSCNAATLVGVVNVDYNQVHRDESKQRSSASDINIRKYTNKVKEAVYQGAYNEIPKTVLVNQRKGIDLACGEGGDINKWFKTGYSHVLLIDKSEKSIYGSTGVKNRVEQFYKDNAGATIKFYYSVGDITTGDLVSGTCETQNLDDARRADGVANIVDFFKAPGEICTISIFYALHYMLQSKVTWDGFMHNVMGILKHHSCSRQVTCVGAFLDGNKITRPFKVLNKDNKVIYSLEPIMNKLVDPALLSLVHTTDDYFSKKVNTLKLDFDATEWNLSEPIRESLVFVQLLPILFDNRIIGDISLLDPKMLEKKDKYKALTASEREYLGMQHFFSFKLPKIVVD